MSRFVRMVALSLAITVVSAPAGAFEIAKGWKAFAISGSVYAGERGDSESSARQKAIASCERHRVGTAPCVATVTQYPYLLVAVTCQRRRGNQIAAKAFVSKPQKDDKVAVEQDLDAQVRKAGFDPKNCKGQGF